MPKIKNILSVNFEDYFCDLPFIRWDEYENRVVKTTPVLLELSNNFIGINVTKKYVGWALLTSVIITWF